MGETLQVKKLIIGAGRPKICIPIMGRTLEELQKDAEIAVNKAADLIEWRADYFIDMEKEEKRKEAVLLLGKVLGEIPLLFTIRTKMEGGEAKLSAEAYQKILTETIRHRNIDLIDVELSHGETMAIQLIELAHENEIKVITSSHDFKKTPRKEEMIQKLCRMQEIGADIPKVAVMPQTERDVLNLLDATLCMKELHKKTPVITMSMGKTGVISRIAGETFGSAVTFGSAGTESAPGQIDAEKLKEILCISSVDECR